MSSTYKLLLLPGDGIGVEVMKQTQNVINFIEEYSDLKFEISEDYIGGAAIDEYGTSLDDRTLNHCAEADVILLGAVGGPKWDNVEYNIRPEAGLLKLRKELGLFANLRPAIVFEPLANSSSLKTELVSGLDIMIVRELTGGIYFGEPRFRKTIEHDVEQAVDTQIYDANEIKRIAHVAFELAQKRQGKLCSVDKANVMETGRLWREVVSTLHSEQYEDIELSHMYVDNCAMQLVRNPAQFDVIVTDNLFGDILSDEASMLTGSLGMLPSACLGEEVDGKRSAMYEPVHGSAPDIAGQNLANPLACILSFAMALKYTLNRSDLSEKIEVAVNKTLSSGLRTNDIMSSGKQQVSCSEMGEEVIKQLSQSLSEAA